jgi:hypothetical protein
MLRLILVAALVGLTQHTFAAEPAEALFPATTKGFLATSSLADARKALELTPLGELAEQESFQPLLDDLQKQVGGQLEKRLGVKLDDVAKVVDGELAVGLIQPDAEKRNSHAVALVADVKGKRAAAEGLLAAAEKSLLAKKAKKKTVKFGDATMTIFELTPGTPDKPADVAVYCLQADTLMLADHQAVAAGMVARLGGTARDNLQLAAGFGEVANKTWAVGKEGPVHVRWFIEPLGYAETSRAAQGGKKQRGVDYIKLLRSQGFAAVAGIGGSVQIHTADREILHRTYAYASPASDAKKGERYKGGANLLEFPNTKDLNIQEWAPNDVSTYLTFQAVPNKVFQGMGSLYDARFEEPGMWEETLDGLKVGEKGPAVDVAMELVAQLTGRLTLIAHYQEPITPKSERLLLALELKPGKEAEASVRGAIDKLLSREDARKTKVEGEDAWELLQELTKEEKAKKKAPKSTGAVTVLQGHLFVASHLDYLQDTLTPHKPADQLANAADVKLILDDLARLGSGSDGFRFFTRGEQSWRMHYELLAKGEMPTAESLLGKWLNRVLPAGEKGAPRKQAIKPALLPPFEDAQPYLGPAGAFTQSDDQGWLTVGSLPKKP